MVFDILINPRRLLDASVVAGSCIESVSGLSMAAFRPADFCDTLYIWLCPLYRDRANSFNNLHVAPLRRFSL
jgi:hypothetical protein